MRPIGAFRIVANKRRQLTGRIVRIMLFI